MTYTDKIFTRNYILTFLATLFVFGSINYLIPILPVYFQNLGYNNSEIGLIVSSYSFSAIFLRPLIGKYASLYGSKKLMLAGTLILTLASPLYLFAKAMLALIIVRILNGAGTASFATSSSIFVSYIAPKRRLAQAIGIYVTSISLATGLAPTLGSWLMQEYPIEIVLLIPAVAALAAVIFTTKIDYQFSPAQESSTKSFKEIIKDNNVIIPSVTWITASFTIGVVMAFLPLYVLTVPGTNAPLFFAVYSMTLISIRFIGGGLSDRFGRMKVIVPSMMLIVSGILGLAFIRGPLSLAVCAIVYGLGFGLAYPSMAALVVDNSDTASRGMALGIFSASVDAGQFLGPFSMGIVSQLAGFEVMFALTALVPLLGVAFFWVMYGLLPQIKRKNKEE